MRRSRPCSDERGSASLEFITVGLILLVPLVYLMIAVASIQSAALAVEGGARQAARVFVQGANEQDARAAAIRAVDFAFADQALESDPEIVITCSPDPDSCLSRGGLVRVGVTVWVSLPLTPPAIGDALSLEVPVSATATQRVSRFWASG